MYVAEDTLENSINVSGIAQLLDASSVRFQITKKHVEDISNKTKYYLIKKYNEANSLLKRKFAEAVAPGQGDAFTATILETNQNPDEGNIVSEEVTELLKAFTESDSFRKLVILSLIDHEWYTQEYISNIFECSLYLVKKARKWKMELNGIMIPDTKPNYRERLDIAKCEHFLNYLFASGMLQHVGYSVTTLKFDCGSTKTIPHAILTAKYSHIVSFYL